MWILKGIVDRTYKVASYNLLLTSYSNSENMKIKITFCIVFGMLFSNAAISQETPFKNIADVNLNGAKRTDIAKSKSLKIGKSKYSIVNSLESNVGELYEINGMLLFINGDSGELEKNHLENLEKGFKEMWGWRSGDPEISKIETFGQYRVLVMSYEFKNREIWRYSFYAVSKSNKKIIVGRLEYDPADKAKASETLSKFIKTIKFK